MVEVHVCVEVAAGGVRGGLGKSKIVCGGVVGILMGGIGIDGGV
jgi:hypothetical protein